MLIKENVIKICNNRIVKYIFFGGLTTLVNIFSFFLLRNFSSLSVNIANIISIIIAIIFAYLVNSRYVFETICKNKTDKLEEFIKFVSARISTMLIEVVGVYMLLEIFKINDYVSKVLIQFVVLILNYIFSKLIVFKYKNENQE